MFEVLLIEQNIGLLFETGKIFTKRNTGIESYMYTMSKINGK